MAHKLLRPATVGLAGAAAALAVVTAGPASADVSANYINVVGTTFQTGQTYTIQVTVPAGSQATIQETINGGLNTGIIGLAQAPAGSTVATYQWTPTTPGTHGIWATVTSTTYSTGTAMVNVTGTATTTPGTGSSNTGDGVTVGYGSSQLATAPVIGPIVTAVAALPVIGPLLAALGL